MSSSSVELSVEDGIAHLTLGRPKAGNAIHASFVAELREHAESLAARPDVRVVVLSGRGENFCVGGDLAYFATLGDDLEASIRTLADDFHAGVSTLLALDAPLIAVVRGAAAGGGLSLVCAADLVLAAESARFTMAYTGAGLSPDGGASWFLPRVVGLRLAAELLLTSRRLSAAEAKSAGIVTEVITDLSSTQPRRSSRSGSPPARRGHSGRSSDCSRRRPRAPSPSSSTPRPPRSPATHRVPTAARVWPRSLRSAGPASAPGPRSRTRRSTDHLVGGHQRPTSGELAMRCDP